MENRSHALAAGLFTLLLGLAAAVALWWLGQSGEASSTYLLETRKSVTGLNIQAQVRYRGIRAGKVEAIEPDPADPRVILVRISLDDRFRLTRGATAKLGFQGVTGLAFVQIDDDGANPELLTRQDGQPPRIALKPNLLDALGEKAEGIVTQVAAVSARLAQVLDEKNTQQLARTLENVAVASEGLRELPQLMASLREALSENNLRNLRQILAHVEKTAGEAAPLTAEMRAMVTSMTALSRRFEQIAGNAGDELSTSTLPRANALMRELTTNSRQLTRILGNLEDNPQMLIFGRSAPPPGPGEAGFVAPVEKGN